MFGPRTNTSRAPLGFWGVFELALQALFIFVIIGVICRFCWTDHADPYKCSALLNNGSWLDPARSRNFHDDFKNWQPPGCMMHEYKAEDIQECFRDRRLLFIGDSTVRQIYWAVVSKLDEERAVSEEATMINMDQKHLDVDFMSRGVKVQFIWDPFLNSSKLEHELKYFKPNPSPGVVDSSAGLILAGAPGLWYAQDGTENYFKEFRDSVDHIISFMDHNFNSRAPKSKPFVAQNDSPNLLFLAPVQVPRYRLLDPGKAKIITRTKIEQMNEYLQQISAHSEADIVWSYSAMIQNGIRQYKDSIHVTRNVNVRKADVLLNLRCNGISAKMGQHFNRTCCSSYTKTAGAQWLIPLLGIVVFTMLLLGKSRFARRFGHCLPPANVVKAFAIFTLTVILCFYTDRTQLFEKGHKNFTVSMFRWSCLAIGLTGVFFIRPNKSTRNTKSEHIDCDFLPREQTDEWKGWMQCLILAYHYTGASQTLWIYKVVRLLVASYLFMTGYGHTLYFLRQNDYSLKRFAASLIRLNLLSCVLPYIMRTNCQTYYFAPLVTYWFWVIYWTLKTGRSYNTSLTTLFGKLLVSASSTYVLTNYFSILQLVKFVLKYTCAISVDVREWSFRTNLDMFIVYFGMIFAALYHRSTQILLRNTRMDTFLSFLRSNDGRVLALILAPFAIPGFWSLARRASVKETYNAWHPYISIIPVLSYIILRNTDVTIHKYRINLRRHHSVIFAWVGRFSLETFVLQYHIWLAGDAKGLLQTGIFGPYLNFAVLTMLFFWLSWCTADATQRITDWICYEAPSRSPDTDSYEMSNRHTLPTSRMSKKDNGREDMKGVIGVWLFGGLLSLRISLRLRLGALLFVMWVGNVTYHWW